MRATACVSFVGATLAVCGCSLIFDPYRFVGDDGRVPPGQDDVASRIDAGGDGPATPFCAPFADAAFCDDFDKATPTERWSADGISNGSLDLVREQGEAFLRATLVSATADGTAYILKNLPSTPPTRMRFSFRVRTDRYPLEHVHLCAIKFYGPSDEWALAFFARSGGFGVFEQKNPGQSSQPFRMYELSSPDPGAWTRVELGIAWDEQPARLSVKLDGQPVPVVSQPSVAEIPRLKPTIVAGAGWSRPSQAIVVDVDDVLVEME